MYFARWRFPNDSGMVPESWLPIRELKIVLKI